MTVYLLDTIFLGIGLFCMWLPILNSDNPLPFIIGVIPLTGTVIRTINVNLTIHFCGESYAILATVERYIRSQKDARNQRNNPEDTDGKQE